MNKAKGHTVDDPCHWPLTVPSLYEEGWQRVTSGEVAIWIPISIPGKSAKRVLQWS